MAGDHWALGYLGRPWQAGRFECVDLVLEVTCRQFGRAPALPPYAPTLRGRDAQVAALAEVYATPVAVPGDGDVGLMAPLGWRGTGHHLGVACWLSEHLHILHCMERGGVCLHAPHALRACGLELRGWYHWHDEETHHVLAQ